MTIVTKPNSDDRRKGLRSIAVALAACGVLSLAPGALLAQVKPKLRTIKLEIRDGKVTAPEKTFRVNEGEEVDISWSTDKTVELHLHGYDIHAFAKPGSIAHMTFIAKTAGRFPITAHDLGHGTLVYLEVYPR